MTLLLLATARYRAAMSKQKREDPVMIAVRNRAAASGLTQQQLGERMGYPSESAKQSFHQFLKTSNPQISMLRRFAKAVDIQLATLLK